MRRVCRAARACPTRFTRHWLALLCCVWLLGSAAVPARAQSLIADGMRDVAFEPEVTVYDPPSLDEDPHRERELVVQDGGAMAGSRFTIAPWNGDMRSELYADVVTSTNLYQGAGGRAYYRGLHLSVPGLGDAHGDQPGPTDSIEASAFGFLHTGSLFQVGLRLGVSAGLGARCDAPVARCAAADNLQNDALHARLGDFINHVQHDLASRTSFHLRVDRGFFFGQWDLGWDADIASGNTSDRHVIRTGFELGGGADLWSFAIGYVTALVRPGLAPLDWEGGPDGWRRAGSVQLSGRLTYAWISPYAVLTFPTRSRANPMLTAGVEFNM